MDGGTFVTSVSAAYPKADGDRAARALSLRMQQEEEEQRLKDQMRVRADLEAREEQLKAREEAYMAEYEAESMAFLAQTRASLNHDEDGNGSTPRLSSSHANPAFVIEAEEEAREAMADMRAADAELRAARAAFREAQRVKRLMGEKTRALETVREKHRHTMKNLTSALEVTALLREELELRSNLQQRLDAEAAEVLAAADVALTSRHDRRRDGGGAGGGGGKRKRRGKHASPRPSAPKDRDLHNLKLQIIAQKEETTAISQDVAHFEGLLTEETKRSARAKAKVEVVEEEVRDLRKTLTYITDQNRALKRKQEGASRELQRLDQRLENDMQRRVREFVKEQDRKQRVELSAIRKYGVRLEGDNAAEEEADALRAKLTDALALQRKLKATRRGLKAHLQALNEGDFFYQFGEELWGNKSGEHSRSVLASAEHTPPQGSAPREGAGASTSPNDRLPRREPIAVRAARRAAGGDASGDGAEGQHEVVVRRGRPQRDARGAANRGSLSTRERSRKSPQADTAAGSPDATVEGSPGKRRVSNSPRRPSDAVDKDARSRGSAPETRVSPPGSRHQPQSLANAWSDDQSSAGGDPPMSKREYPVLSGIPNKASGNPYLSGPARAAHTNLVRKASGKNLRGGSGSGSGRRGIDTGVRRPRTDKGRAAAAARARAEVDLDVPENLPPVKPPTRSLSQSFSSRPSSRGSISVKRNAPTAGGGIGGAVRVSSRESVGDVEVVRSVGSIVMTKGRS